jgi:hypothetical protein
MTGETALIALQQLLGQLPLLLAYLVGLILALIFLKRCPGPALLTLVGAGISMVAIVIQAFLAQYVFSQRVNLGVDAQALSTMLATVGIMTSILRAVGVGTFLAAIFMGRKKQAPHLSSV